MRKRLTEELEPLRLDLAELLLDVFGTLPGRLVFGICGFQPVSDGLEAFVSAHVGCQAFEFCSQGFDTILKLFLYFCVVALRSCQCHLILTGTVWTYLSQVFVEVVKVDFNTVVSDV